MVTHATYRRWISRELDGELEAAARRQLEEHLEGCEECRAERQQMASISSILRSDATSGRTVGLPERILSRIEEASAGEVAPAAPAPEGPGVVRVLRASAAVAAALLIVASLFQWGLSPDEALADPVDDAARFQLEEEYLRVVRERSEERQPDENLGYLSRFLEEWRGGR